jgi:hypothetical protein
VTVWTPQQTGAFADGQVTCLFALWHRDQRDEDNAAEKVGDMSGFYGNLLTKNVAFGTNG